MKLARLLESNRDGLTFVRKGLDYEPVYFKTGFMVSLTDNVTGNPSQQDIEQIEALAKRLGLKQAYFGYWFDERQAKHYLDLSLHIVNKEQATTIGKVFNQKAIFDCSKLETLYI